MLNRLKSPVAFLTLSNIFGAGVGFVSGMLVARWIGTEGYGVTGVITAVNTSVLCFWDTRLSDVMAKLYFEKDATSGDDLPRFRASIIQSGLLCYGLLALIFLVAGIAANLTLPRFFTSTEVKLSWVIVSAVATSLNFFLNPIGFMLRLSGRFRLLGIQAMAGSLVSSCSLVLCVWLSRNLDGYYSGILLSNLLGGALVVAVALTVWLRYEKLPILSALDLSALKLFRKHSRLLFWGKFLGYVKLGHRAADVLLVGYFCNDSMTGLYKMARSLTDKLYLLFDAMNQVYFPTFLKMLADREFAAFRRLARKIALGTLGLTAAFLAAELAGLPFFIQYVLKGQFAGVEPSILVLTLPFFFVAGMHIWIWPLVIHYDMSRRFTQLNVLALLVQYGVGILAFKLLGNVVGFSLGYLGYYMLLIGLGWILVSRQAPEAAATGFLRKG